MSETTTGLLPTPGQTVGPFFHYGLPYEGDRDLVLPGSAGAIRLSGTVYDGHGAPIPDALIEIWQARPDGTISQAHGSIRRDGWTFTGFGRASTGRDGSYSFSTLTPGPTEEGKPAFWAVTLFARGLLNRLFTRAYLPGPATDADPFLASLTAAERASLIATPDAQGFVFDLHLQGEAETVFLQHG
ncbi:protocatechuate 3,4-dioxygenase subunit alpha [Nocardioides sp.]|uniref:protocatechuate 3,4-dioxygenase subunit alpha n=1 Tax=Nocardioides sp. TaxID=35761 RepID=UPI00261433F3|nr:protocatechuate 3,4-dioxygenase subunit alpha [Nocardioides sp.]